MSHITLTDIHSHILPGIDDGAKDIEEAKKLLEMSVKQGIERIIFTPHFYSERMKIQDFVAKRDRVAEIVKGMIHSEGLDIETKMGTEVYFTPIIANFPLEQLAFSGTKYILIELITMYEPNDVVGAIKRIKHQGYTPIIAHVERYSYVAKNPVLLYEWIKAGALIQVNAESIISSRKIRKSIEQYCRWNLIHFVASDAHSVAHRPQNLEKGYALLSEEMSKKIINNANIVFAGGKFEIEKPYKPHNRLGKWR